MFDTLCLSRKINWNDLPHNPLITLLFCAKTCFDCRRIGPLKFIPVEYRFSLRFWIYILWKEVYIYGSHLYVCGNQSPYSRANTIIIQSSKNNGSLMLAMDTFVKKGTFHQQIFIFVGETYVHLKRVHLR